MPDPQTAPAPGAAPFTGGATRPEVLAPAGDRDCIRAAVENGADAVYFGLHKFNARVRATNFTVEELPELLAELRLRGVRAYVALNTLIFSDELPEAARLLERVIEAGPDALILQDLGLARLARRISPDVVLHASTQTTTTCAESMGALRELGFSRVILARELSLKEIRVIAPAAPLELECFVHGALCVAYSGQCLTSEALGGRSANRGACAQACRLPYDLVVDGEVRDLGDRSFLLSPLDLAAYDLVPQLVAAGIRSFKIEGRLKTPEYVAATTRAYRKAVDGATAWSRDEVLELQQVFSRGFSHAFLDGTDHQTLVPAQSSKKRGPFLGTVREPRGDRVQVLLENPVKPGDGVAFDYGDPERETGGPVYEIRRDGARVASADVGQDVELAFGPIDASRIHVGDRVWKTGDPALEARLRSTFSKVGRRVPVDAVVSGAADGPLVLRLSDGRHHVEVTSDVPLEVARNRPLTPEYLRNHLGRLGAGCFELEGLDVRLEGPVILPVSRLNELRRRAVAELERVRRSTPGVAIDRGALESLRRGGGRGEGDARLVALCRTEEQAEAAKGCAELVLDFEDVRRYRGAGAGVTVAPPRITKPGETGILRRVLESGAGAVLVRNLAQLDFFAGKMSMRGDYSLNVANDLTADWFLSRGLERFVPSYDLNAAQLGALLERVPAGRAEVVVHQHMPMFHLEHCVYAARLSKGHDATDCGRPCDRHKVSLRDRTGREHPLSADVGCRNTVFNATPQSASPYVRGLLEAGVRWFRVELLREDGPAAARLVRAYRELLAGERDGATLWRELNASETVGVTRGPLAF